MASRFAKLLLILFLSLAAAPGQTAGRSRHVVVISLDGFPAYALRDPTLPLPVLRKLIGEGAAAEAMKPVNPTVTWPNHTSMVTGVPPAEHGVIYNGLPVRGGEGRPLRVDPYAPKTVLVKAQTVYDAAHEAGLTTAEVDWVAVLRAPTIDWSFPEQAKPDGKLEREMVAAGAATEEEIRNFAKAPITFRDELWMRAAAYLIERHKPNLLLLHLLTTDSVQHQYGARSLAAQTALVLADRQIQRVLDAIERAGIRDSTTVFVVSDHGFQSYEHLIRPNALLRQKGLLRDGDCDAWVITEGGTAMVYFTRGTVPGLQEEFARLPGVARVILPDEYARYGYPKVEPQGRMADMVLAAAPGYAFDPVTTGAPEVDVPPGVHLGTHGYLADDPDMQAIFVAWGAGIKAGAKLGTFPNLDVAPTIARLLGVKLPAAKGAVLSEMLR
jgi:predicted AlkP superfamily pyrophosphatase or phosphodiesterase